MKRPGTASTSNPAVAIVTTTIALPVEALTVTAAPPALVTNRNPEHLGLSRGDLLDVLRAMRADSRFADDVIVRGKLRGAPPERILLFLREHTARTSNKAADAPANDNPGDGVSSLLQEIGCEHVARRASR